jgi:arginase
VLDAPSNLGLRPPAPGVVPGVYKLAGALRDHFDFRHPGNAEKPDAVAGEDLALVTGRGGVLAELEGVRPLVREEDVLAIGPRSDDEALAEVTATAIAVQTDTDVRTTGAGQIGARAVTSLESADGFWLHLDADIIDPETMPAVDSPDPGGLGLAEVAALLRPLLASPRAMGLEVTILDPDLDEDGTLAGRFADLIVDALRPT